MENLSWFCRRNKSGQRSFCHCEERFLRSSVFRCRNLLLAMQEIASLRRTVFARSQ